MNRRYQKHYPQEESYGGFVVLIIIAIVVCLSFERGQARD